jgi:hypothetical protein
MTGTRLGMGLAFVFGLTAGAGLVYVGSNVARRDATDEVLRTQAAELKALRRTIEARDLPHFAPAPSALSRPELEQVVGEALARAAVAPPTGAAPQPAPEPTVSERHAFEQARSIVEAAVANKRWTDDRRASLRRLLPAMTDEQRESALRDLAEATNQRGLQLETSGPPI